MTSEVMARRASARHHRSMSITHPFQSPLAEGRAPESVGTMLRTWRQRRRRSQLDLAADVPISQRHLSCLERGLARPSRETALRLAEALELPPTATNALLAAAGFAPAHPLRSLAAPDMAAMRAAVERILAAHEPFPALAIDRHWTLITANRAVAPLIAGVDPVLAAPPTNVLRLSLHPDGLAPRIVNVREWRAHVIARLHAEVERSGDGVLAALLDELKGYPLPAGARPHRLGAPDPLAGIAVPLVLETPAGRLSLISATTVFGTAVDVTLAGVAIETFLPADAETAALLEQAGRG